MRRHVDGDKLVLPLGVDVGHRAVGAEARVVHQHVDLTIAKRRDKSPDALVGAQITDDKVDRDVG